MFSIGTRANSVRAGISVSITEPFGDTG